MDANRQEARRLFEQEHLSPIEIAGRLGIPAGTVRGWKCKDRWRSGTLEHQNAPERSPETLRARENCWPPFQPRNQAATLHGLFARYLPEETRDITQQLQDRGPLDVLWDQIQLAYAALIRAQKLMHVKDITDHSTTKVGDSTSQYGGSETLEIQYAWDKQASFLNAQAKQQSVLAKMLMQYDELCRSELATEEQRVRVDKLRHDMALGERRLEIELIKAENATGTAGEDTPDDNFVQAMDGQAAEVWADGPDED